MPDLQTGRMLPAPSRAERNVANASKGHCVAHAVLGAGAGVRVQAESHLELCHLLLLNADPAIADLQEQARFHFGTPGDAHCHVFDVVATRTSGMRIAYTVKPEVRLTPAEIPAKGAGVGLLLSLPSAATRSPARSPTLAAKPQSGKKHFAFSARGQCCCRRAVPSRRTSPA